MHVPPSDQPVPPALPCVLAVEDDDDDYFFLERAVTKATNQVHLVRGKNGAEAIQYLQDNIGNPPILVVTDLKMPRLDGFGLLSWLKSNPKFARVPVLVWSGSEWPEDRNRAESLGARSYHAKGIVHEGLVAIVAQICAALLSRP